MGLIEAAACNLALVTSCGPGMEHVSELFDDGREAILVSNALPPDDRARAYSEALAALVTDAARCEILRGAAHRAVADGTLSLARYSGGLQTLYARALERARPPLRQRPTSSPHHVWDERTCHWVLRARTPAGGLRIRL